MCTAEEAAGLMMNIRLASATKSIIMVRAIAVAMGDAAARSEIMGDVGSPTRDMIAAKMGGGRR